MNSTDNDTRAIQTWEDRMRDPNREFGGQIDCMADEIKELRAALGAAYDAIAKATKGAA